MGCDIHLHTEIQLEEGGPWLHYNHVRVERSYEIFRLMSEVRGGTPIVPPKGVPSDMSAVTAADYAWWDGDAHSDSWFDGEEIATLYSRIIEIQLKHSEYPNLGEVFGYCFGSRYDFQTRYPDEAKPYHSVRFVFWFDN